MRHQYEVRFYGCKHILLEQYDIIRDEIQPRKYGILIEISLVRSEASLFGQVICTTAVTSRTQRRWRGSEVLLSSTLGGEARFGHSYEYSNSRPTYIVYMHAIAILLLPGRYKSEKKYYRLGEFLKKTTDICW